MLKVSLKTILVLLLLAFLSIECHAQKAIAQNKRKYNSILYTKVKSILKKSEVGDLNVGIYIKDLTNKSVKFSYHSKRMFIPASVTNRTFARR